MRIACVTCIINVYLSNLFPQVYNNYNLCFPCVTFQKWRLKNKPTYIHTLYSCTQINYTQLRMVPKCLLPK